MTNAEARMTNNGKLGFQALGFFRH